METQETVNIGLTKELIYRDIAADEFVRKPKKYLNYDSRYVTVETVALGKTFTISKASVVHPKDISRIIIAEGMARKSHTDGPDFRGAEISKGRAVKALIKKLNGKSSFHDMFVG